MYGKRGDCRLAWVVRRLRSLHPQEGDAPIKKIDMLRGTQTWCFMEKIILLHRARVKLRTPGCRAGNLNTIPSELSWLQIMSVPDAKSKMNKKSGKSG
jgi:hypothetical protein